MIGKYLNTVSCHINARSFDFSLPPKQYILFYNLIRLSLLFFRKYMQIYKRFLDNPFLFKNVICLHFEQDSAKNVLHIYRKEFSVVQMKDVVSLF